MRFAAAQSRGGWLGIGLLVVLVAVEAVVIGWVVRHPVGPAAAMLGLLAVATVPLIARLAYWVWGFFTLAYEVGRDGVVIRWAASRQVVPMADIRRVRRGRRYESSFAGVRWPGYEVGHTQVADDTGTPVECMVYATAGLEAQVLLFASGGVAYAISPHDPAAFVEELKRRRSLGAVKSLSQETVRPRVLSLPVWSDSATLRLLVGALALNALLFAWTAWRFPDLPPTLALRYQVEAAGALVPGPERPVTAIWTFPLIGLLVLVCNGALALGVHHKARVGAALLAGGAAWVQALIGLAMLRIG